MLLILLLKGLVDQVVEIKLRTVFLCANRVRPQRCVVRIDKTSNSIRAHLRGAFASSRSPLRGLVSLAAAISLLSQSMVGTSRLVLFPELYLCSILLLN